MTSSAPWHPITKGASVNFWHELNLSDWRIWQELGDFYLPWRQYLRKFAASEFEYKASDFEGRGIVIPAGGRLLPGAYVTVSLLRTKLSCDLPIEIWHLGDAEIPSLWRELFEHLDVTFRDAHELPQGRGLSGWQLKPFSIINSAFAEVMLIDADNVPVSDPVFLFEAPEYIAHGSLFWPDRTRIGPDHSIWRVFGVDYRDEPSHETGQIVIDKARTWHALQIAMHCNQFAKFHYRHSHGDTATFRFAFHLLGQSFGMIPHRLIEVPVDRVVEEIETLKDTPYLRQEGDIRAMFVQRDPEGKVLFQHRTAGGGAQAAFGLGENKRIQHFALEDECFEILDDAREFVMKSGPRAEIELIHGHRLSPHRREGILRLVDLIIEREAKEFVETGCIRQKDNWHGDGYFGYWLGLMAARIGGHVWTVDLDAEALKLAAEVTHEWHLFTDHIEQDSVAALKRRTNHIDVLVLDSLDYHAGQEKQAQAHCLNEVIAALPKMSDRGIIAIDDCKLAGGGKGGLAVPYLQGLGWKLDHDGYIAILTNPKGILP